MTVTPSASSITTAQALTVTVAVSGGTGNPTPTGSVTLTGGGYTSAATTLSSGSASINIPANSLSAGTDSLAVTYTPDSSSSSTFNSATGSATVTVTTPTKTTPTVTVTPSASSITTAQPLTVAVSVNGGTGNPTPTGTVTLSSGSYSAQQTLASGTASFNIAAGTLGNGANTLTASYSGDATYAVASSTTTVTVEPVSISTTDTFGGKSWEQHHVDLNSDRKRRLLGHDEFELFADEFADWRTESSHMRAESDERDHRFRWQRHLDADCQYDGGLDHCSGAANRPALVEAGWWWCGTGGIAVLRHSVSSPPLDIDAGSAAFGCCCRGNRLRWGRGHKRRGRRRLKHTGNHRW